MGRSKFFRITVISVAGVNTLVRAIVGLVHRSWAAEQYLEPPGADEALSNRNDAH